MIARLPHGTLTLVARLRLIVFTTLAAVLVTSLLGSLGGPTRPAQAALVDDGSLSTVLIGRDDDNLANPLYQPADVAANQTLNNADVLTGRNGQDILIGLLGSDVLDGGPGNDYLIGGPEQGTQPNSDVIFGGDGNDVNIWAPGDGSDAFIGGGSLDAMVFGVIDRDDKNVPTLTGSFHSYPSGIPTANVSGQGGFCIIERVADPTAGYEFLARFFVRATGNLAVTIRLSDVEQVFCTSQVGGQITYADLREADPQFVTVAHEQVQTINPLVAAAIR